jgi:acyl-CoA synthetase (NDP forming)
LTASKPTSRVARLLQARSVAIVGASGGPSKITGRPLAYMLARGYTGELYPVNPGRAEVQGLRSYPSLSAIGKPVDLAIVGTAADQVEGVVREGIAAGVKAFVVFSSGFAETGAAGRLLQDRLARLARDHDVAIVGPNCLGLANAATGLIASFTTALEESALAKGSFAFVSQSGALGAYWLDIVLRSGLGFSQWITTGNECDVGAAEAIDYLVDDADTRVIGVYLEDIRDTDAFRRALLRAAAAGKPVIAIKSGRSQAGAQAAASHTGALAGDDSLYDACLTQCGALRVDSLTDMMDVARLFLFDSVPRGKRLAVMSVSGGAGVLIADEAEGLGLAVPPFAETTLAALKPVLPAFGHPANPLDLTGNVVQNTGSIARAFAAVGADDNVDAIVLFVGLMHSIAGAFTETLATARQEIRQPVVVVWIGATADTVATIEAARLPVFGDIPQAIRALAAAVRMKELRQEAGTCPPPVPGSAGVPGSPRTVSEWDGKQLLQGQDAVRIPAGVLVVPGAPLPAIAEGSMVAAKLQSAQLLHKSDAGGVILRIRTPDELAGAVSRLQALAGKLRIPVQGMLVETMVAFDHELLLGLRRDARFGPLLTIARGGVEVELDADAVSRLLPLDARQVEGMLRSLRSARLLEGFRGRPAADIPRLAQRIADLCRWFMERRELAEVEINPLAVRGGDAWALDALVTTLS